MSQYLNCGDFSWLNQAEINNLDVKWIPEYMWLHIRS